MTHPPTDGQLLQRFASLGDESAYEELLQRHGAMVFRLCRRLTASTHDAEDAGQKVFAILAQRAYELTDHRSLAGWLYSTAWHIASHERRDAARRRRREMRAAMRIISERPDELERDEFHRELYRAIEMLPEDYRTAIVLHHLQGMGIAELAAVVGAPMGTIAARLSRGRTMIRERMARRGQPLTAIALMNFLDGDIHSVQGPKTAIPMADAIARARAAQAMAPLAKAEVAAAAISAAPTSTPTAAGVFFGLLQGRAAIITVTLVVLTAAGSAPAARTWARFGQQIRAAIVGETTPPSYTPVLVAGAPRERPRIPGYSQSGSSLGTSVPEPGAALTLGTSAWLYVLRRPRRSRR